MSTIRVGKRDRHTTIDRRAINDGRLSFKARGLLAWLLDKPDDWRINRDAIAQHGPDGKAAIQTALQELTLKGYLIRNKVRNSDGTFAVESVLFEVPTTTENRAVVSGVTTTENPAPENPAPENRSVIKELKPNTEIKPRSSNFKRQNQTPSDGARFPEWSEERRQFLESLVEESR